MKKTKKTASKIIQCKYCWLRFEVEPIDVHYADGWDDYDYAVTCPICSQSRGIGYRLAKRLMKPRRI